MRRVSFIGGLVTAVLVFLMLIYALIAMIVPNVIDSIESLLQKDRLESYYNTISDWINRTFTGTPVETWFHDNLNDLLTFITDKLREIDLGSFVVDLTSSVYSVVMGVFSFLLGIIAAVYILIFKKGAVLAVEEDRRRVVQTRAREPAVRAGAPHEPYFRRLCDRKAHRRADRRRDYIHLHADREPALCGAGLGARGRDERDPVLPGR